MTDNEALTVADLNSPYIRPSTVNVGRTPARGEKYDGPAYSARTRTFVFSPSQVCFRRHSFLTNARSLESYQGRELQSRDPLFSGLGACSVCNQA